MTTPALGDADGWRAFTATVVARVGSRDPLDILSETAGHFEAMLHGRSDADVHRPEAPGRWSVTAVLEHLADAELVFGYRLRQVLTQDAPRLTSFDQDGWAARGRYAAGDARAALTLFAALRARHLDLWRHLTEAEWERVGVHGDRGMESLRTMARIIAGHDLAHRDQVARILNGAPQLVQPPATTLPPSSPGMDRLDLVTLVVSDYAPAIAFFVDVLHFTLVEDVPALTNDGRPKRWVVVRPAGGGTGLLLARAEGAAQAAVVGQQAAGRVGFFLRVDDFDATYARLVRAGVVFVTPPRVEPYGPVAVFLDVAGNRWDLLGRAGLVATPTDGSFTMASAPHRESDARHPSPTDSHSA